MTITPSDLKNQSYSVGLGVTLIVLGTIMIFVSPQALIKFLFIVIGICLLISGLLATLLSSGSSTWGLIEGICEIIIGTTCLFYHNYIFTTIIGAFMIAAPVIKAFFVNKESTLKSLKRSMPIMIMGLILVLSSQSNLIGRILFHSMGTALLLIGIYYLIPSKYFKNFKGKKNTKVDKSNVIDVEAE